MAINNWRFVVTWWYMDPNGNIIEEKQFIPSTTPVVNNTPSTSTGSNIPTFSNAEVYWLQSQWYANQWDTDMANAFWAIAWDLGKYEKFWNTSINIADSLLNYIRWNEAWLQWVSWNLYNQLVNDLQNQRNYVYDTFWPEWTLTKEVNSYYDDLWDYLATDAGRQAAQIAAQWVHSWASLWAIRAQQNEAYNESFQRYIQAKEQQINAKMQIASNLINFMSTLRQEYWDTTNQYVIEMYKRANDYYNTIAQSAAADLDEYNQALATPASWSSSNSNITWISRVNNLMANWMSYEDAVKQAVLEWYLSPSILSTTSSISWDNNNSSSIITNPANKSSTTNNNKWFWSNLLQRWIGKAIDSALKK